MNSFALLASTADHGTRSISASFRAIIQPEADLECKLGFRRMGVSGWAEGRRFIQARNRGTIICLFNAPILLAAAFRHRRGERCVGILDWTESYPSQRRKRWTRAYDRVYVTAFRRLDAVYSPSAGFRAYYNSLGSSIQPCLYPLPRAIPGAFRTEIPQHARILYIGADYRRKGGDVLLEGWRSRLPAHASLAFVCPAPPEGDIPGVTYRRDIRAGTDEQARLFDEYDLFVLPTREEPFGFALLEAINAGMCTITTQAAGAAEIVRASGGIVVDTPEEAVAEALRISADRQEISARRAACADFLPRYARAVQDSLEEVLHGGAEMSRRLPGGTS